MEKRKNKNIRKMTAGLSALIAGFGILATAGSGFAIWYFSTSQTASAGASVIIGVAVDLSSATVDPPSFKAVLAGNSGVTNNDIYYANTDETRITTINIKPIGTNLESASSVKWIYTVTNGASTYVSITGVPTTETAFSASELANGATVTLPAMAYTSSKPTNITQYSAMVAAISSVKITFNFTVKVYQS